MTVEGFFLNCIRQSYCINAFASASRGTFQVFTTTELGTPPTYSSIEMASTQLNCPANANCPLKVAFYAAGIVVGSALLGYYIGVQITKRMSRINTTIKLSTDKVVDTVDVEDIGEKKVFCRCWKSSKFPYCDGSHNKHNATTGDNVGPLIIAKKMDSK